MYIAIRFFVPAKNFLSPQNKIHLYSVKGMAKMAAYIFCL